MRRPALQRGPAALAVLLVLAAAAAAQDLYRPTPAEEDIVRAVGERWFGVYMADQKIGYFVERIGSRGREPEKVWVVRNDAVLRLTAMGRKTEMRFREEMVFDATPPHALREGSSFKANGANASTVTLRREGDCFVALLREGGVARRRELPPPDVRLADVLALEAWIRTRPEAGAAIHTRSYDVEDLEADIESYTLAKAWETVVEGVNQLVYELQAASQRDGDLGVMRVDGDGNLLSAALGGFAEIRREPRGVAVRIAYGRDLFVFGMAKLDRPLGMDPGEVARLVLEGRGEGAPSLPPGPRQDVVVGEGKVILRLGEGELPRASEEEIAENLKDSARYPAHHEKVQALAREAAGDAASDVEKTEKLVAFTDAFIADSYNADALSFFEIVAARKGDCTEHAHVFTVLARACGIPAREVSGLVYMGDRHKAFGGHAWAEVVLDGRWTPVDPTWGQTNVDATHIRLDLEGQTRSLQTLGRIEFLLVSVERRGKEDE